MDKSVHVLIVGGGIAGLTLANLLVHGDRKNKFQVTLFESRPDCENHGESIGGGIGLWPPSQSVLRNIPNYEKFIKQFGFPMPPPSYRDSNGSILAQASKNFGKLFPVQCLNRDNLIHMLLEGVKDRNDVQIVTSQKIDGYEREGNKIVLHSDNKTYKGDLLVACDGIHSKIRNGLMAELEHPPVLENNLGYTYFRADVEVPENSKNKWWSAAFETWGESLSKKYGKHDVRFGYVPLKPPHAFWFMAMKTEEDHSHLSPIRGAKVVDDETKAFLKELVQSWKPVLNDSGEQVVDYKELIDSTKKILRTDIAKIDNVQDFPWSSKDGRVVLMGDAAHATAPNIAQGAGLCIEDAACLASKLDRVDYLKGIAEYEKERKPRAETVQFFSDMIASVGQVKNPILKGLRNGIMRTGTTLTPALQQNLFEYFVSSSLGGSSKSMYWQAPPLATADDAHASLFGSVFPEVGELTPQVKDFKTSSTGGSGSGVISVETPSSFAKIIATVGGLPSEMNEQPFHASVVNTSKDGQYWKRIFGYNTPQQKTYSTTHSSYCGLDRQMYLSEGVGGFMDKSIRFIYKITHEPDGSLKYQSQGMTLFDMIKIPLPAFLLPKSEWTETPTEKGWTFDGSVSFPLVGPLLHYYGDFKIDPVDKVQNKRIVIAGGSGMIGKEVCLEFIKKGYEVYCLSRSANTQIDIEGVKVRRIDEDWSDLIDKDTTILNLSGENPGAARWTDSVKKEIAASRFRVIDNILQNIERAHEKPSKYLQASAVGIYGDAGDTPLTEESKSTPAPESGTQFRVDVCEEIEHKASAASCPVVQLRIGHVLSNQGGLLPYYRWAGFFGAGRFGSGHQFVPYVHIQDVAKAIEFIASNKDIVGGAINITAPNPCRNSELLKELKEVKCVPGIPVPESALKLIVGESSAVLTDSERVEPKRLLDEGFKFDYTTIEQSLHGLQ